MNIFKKNKEDSIRTITEHKKICTIPVYLWKDELKNINKKVIMDNLLDYDYYDYTLEKEYNTVKDNKRWITDGDTVMHFRIYEVKVEITYEIETVRYLYSNDTYKYKDITSIKYLGLFRRVPFEDLGIEQIFNDRTQNVLINDISDIDKIHKLKPSTYCRNKYFSMIKDIDLDDEFLKEIYKCKIESFENSSHSYSIIKETNRTIYYIHKIINENKNASKEMLVYKLVTALITA